jgi:hypothetical protein
MAIYMILVSPAFFVLGVARLDNTTYIGWAFFWGGCILGGLTNPVNKNDIYGNEKRKTTRQTRRRNSQ